MRYFLRFSHHLYISCSCLAVILLSYNQVRATCGTTLTWSANANTTAWNTTTNWNPLNVPDANTETAFIIADWRIPTLPNTNRTLSCLEINSGSMTAPSGSVLTISGDYFRNLNPNSIIVPGGSTWQVRMAGTAEQSFENVDTIPRLNINNATTVNLTQPFILTSTFTITAGTGNVNIQANLETRQTTAITIPASATVTISSGVEWRVNGNLTVSGILKLMPGASLKLANGRVLSVSSTGTLQIAGAAGNAAIIDAYDSSSTYTFNVIGRIDAEYFSINRMTATGLNVTGRILDLANGNINYIADGFYGLTLGSAAVSITTINNVGFYGQDATTPLNVNATAYTGSAITFSHYGGIGGATNETDPSNKINWGTPAPAELLLTNNSASGTPPTSIAASSAYTPFATFSFALSSTSTASNITSIKFTISGTNNSADIAGVRVYRDDNNDCVYSSGIDTQVGGTYTPTGSPATFTATFSNGDIQVSDTSPRCVHVLVATSATAQVGNTIGIKISATDDIVNSQSYALSATSGPPINASTSTLTGLAVLRWAGGNGTVMAQANNWSPNTIPTNARDCQIGNGNNIPIMASTFSCLNTELISGGTLNWNSTSNVFQVYGSFEMSTGFTFTNTLTSAILRFMGTSTQSVNFSNHTFPGSVEVNNATGPVVFEGSGTISGSLTLNGGTTRIATGATITVNGGVTVNSGATFDIEPGATLILANGSTFTVNSGGTLEMVGNTLESASVRAENNSSSYVVNVSGTISARYYSFKNLGLTGLTINSGATINSTHPLQNGSFTYPAMNGAVFLRLLRQVPGNTLDFMTFDAAGSSATGTKSITTSTSVGTLNVTNYSGSLTGTTYSTSVNYIVTWAGAANTLNLTQEATAAASGNQGEAVNMGRFGFQQASAGAFADTDITHIRLTLTGTGSVADVSSVSLYYDSACTGSGGTLIGSQTFSGSPARADFNSITGATVPAHATLPTQRCFYVIYKLSLTATHNATVGVQIQSVSHVTNSQSYAFNGSFAPPVSLGTTTIVGTTTYWTGATNTDWATATNWNGGLPTSSLNCVINSATNRPTISTGTQSCKSLTIGTGNLTMTGGILQIYGSFDNTGTFTQGGFPLIMTDDGVTATSQTVSSVSTLTGLQFNKTAGGSVNVGGAALTVSSLITVPSGSHFTLSIPNGKTLIASLGITVSGGTLSVESGGTLKLASGRTLTVNGGTVETTGTNDVYPQSLTNKATITRSAASGTWNFTATSGTLNLVGFVFEWLGTAGLNIGGTTNVAQMNGGQLRSLPSTANMRAIQLNTTGSLPSTISNFGWYWGSGNSVPAQTTTYYLAYSSGCSNRTVSFDQWFGDFWPYTTTTTNAKIFKTNCNILIDKANSPVSLTEFKATPYDRKVVLEWMTGFEWYHKGFNIYRSISPCTGYKKINHELIRNDLFNANLHGSYAFIDNEVNNDTVYYYKLEDISTTEESSMHGPLSAQPNSVLGAPPPPFASTIAGNVPVHQNNGGGNTGDGNTSTHPQTGTTPSAPTPLPHQPLALNEVWSVPGALKIGVLEDGMYELTYEQMRTAGVLSSFVGGDVRNFKLYFLQQEHAMEVSSPSGLFSPGDSLRFFAPHTETMESLSSYMLLVNDMWSPVPGLRMSRVDAGQLSGNFVEATSFSRRIHLEENNVAVFNEPYDQDMDLFVWGLFYGISSGAKVALETEVELPYLDRQKNVLLQVLVKSRRTSMENYNNNLQVSINDLVIDNKTFSGSTVQIVNFQIPGSLFAPGLNRIQLTPSGSQLMSGEYDMVYIDSLDISYSQEWVATADQVLLMNTHTAQDLVVDGFSKVPSRIYDLSTFAQPDLLTNAVSNPTDLGFAVMINTPDDPQKGRRLWISTNDKLLSPASLELNEGSQLSSPANEADVVYIGTKEMLETVGPLADLRRQQGYQTKLVLTKSVYNEFGQGIVDAEAIRQFFTYTQTQWAKRPQYFVLLGDGTYDPKAYQNNEMKNRFPIKLIKGSAFNYAADHWYVTLPDEMVPFAIVGRIPAQTAQELKDYVQKVLSYESTREGALLTLFADRPLYQGENFEEKVADLNTAIAGWSPSMPTQMIQRSLMTDSLFKNNVMASFQNSSVIHFMGHGAENTWADIAVFNNNDVDSLQNTKYPVVVAMNCLNASFYDPSSAGLAEKLVMKKEGGAIAFWGSTSMSPPSVQHVYQKAFYKELFSSKNGTLGSVVKLSKTQAYQQSPFDEVMMSWTIIGDPMIKPTVVRSTESAQGEGTSSSVEGSSSGAGSLGGAKGLSSSPGCSAFASTQRPPSSTPWDLALALFIESYICFVVLRTLRRSFAKLPF